jgi:hypothetical protein
VHCHFFCPRFHYHRLFPSPSLPHLVPADRHRQWEPPSSPRVADVPLCHLSHACAALVQHRDWAGENFHFELSDCLNAEHCRRVEPHSSEDPLPTAPVQVSVQWRVAGAVGLDLPSSSSPLVRRWVIKLRATSSALVTPVHGDRTPSTPGCALVPWGTHWLMDWAGSGNPCAQYHFHFPIRISFRFQIVLGLNPFWICSNLEIG